MKKLFRLLYGALDNRYKAEINPNTSEGRVVFRRLRARNFLDNLKGKRIIEIGPKSGLDSKHLMSLEPRELTMVDLPSKSDRVLEWLSKIQSLGNAKYIETNIQYMSQSDFEELGQYDLVWCTGVLYHNQEQLRLIRRLFDLCDLNGRIVLESEVPRRSYFRSQNAVEIHWPDKLDGTQNITHLPSALAMKSWMEMVGFTDVIEQNIFSWKSSLSRAVLTGKRANKSSPMVVYHDLKNPKWRVGDAL